MTNESTVTVGSKRTGRPKGSANVTTREVRQAIANFVGGNTQRMDEWLAQLAYGIPKVNAKGDVIRDGDGAVVWVNRPAPGDALAAIGNLAEYFVPKLSRQEVEASVRHEMPKDVTAMSTDDLKRLVLHHLGVDAVEGEYSTVKQQVPEFLQPAQEATTQPRAATDATEPPEAR